MPKFPRKLEEKLQKRIDDNAFRELPKKQGLVDFSSNDYLGLAKCKTILESVEARLKKLQIDSHGSSGSRLLTGNHRLYEEVESFLCNHYQFESALVFNSGYDANIGFFSSIPQKGDFVFYDELSHASIREGIAMSNAKSYKFAHNDLENLRGKIDKLVGIQSEDPNVEIYVVTESVFSMDGDSPDLKAFSQFCSERGLNLVVDEAHAIGVFGTGLIDAKAVFAKIITFGKALGCHGAAILGGERLKDYLVNFARSLIYTTALPPHSLAVIQGSYEYLQEKGSERKEQLEANIDFFKQEMERLNIGGKFIPSNSAIHCMLVPGNEKVKKLSNILAKAGFEVKPILSPTVKKGEERLRFCLHAYNSKEEISNVLEIITKHI